MNDVALVVDTDAERFVVALGERLNDDFILVNSGTNVNSYGRITNYWALLTKLV